MPIGGMASAPGTGSPAEAYLVYNDRVALSKNCASAGLAAQAANSVLPPARDRVRAQRVEGSNPSMIRFLQKDNRLAKALFVVIIAAASVSMVRLPDSRIDAAGPSSPDTYAVVYPHWYSRFFSSGDEISQQRWSSLPASSCSGSNPQYADNPMIVKMFEPQVGQQLVQQQMLLEEADKLGIRATDDDVRQYLQTGPTGQVLFPNGKFIGADQYTR